MNNILQKHFYLSVILLSLMYVCILSILIFTILIGKYVLTIFSFLFLLLIGWPLIKKISKFAFISNLTKDEVMVTDIESIKSYLLFKKIEIKINNEYNSFYILPLNKMIHNQDKIAYTLNSHGNIIILNILKNNNF